MWLWIFTLFISRRSPSNPCLKGLIRTCMANYYKHKEKGLIPTRKFFFFRKLNFKVAKGAMREKKKKNSSDFRWKGWD